MKIPLTAVSNLSRLKPAKAEHSGPHSAESLNTFNFKHRNHRTCGFDLPLKLSICSHMWLKVLRYSTSCTTALCQYNSDFFLWCAYMQVLLHGPWSMHYKHISSSGFYFNYCASLHTSCIWHWGLSEKQKHHWFYYIKGKKGKLQFIICFYFSNATWFFIATGIFTFCFTFAVQCCFI